MIYDMIYSTFGSSLLDGKGRKRDFAGRGLLCLVWVFMLGKEGINDKNPTKSTLILKKNS